MKRFNAHFVDGWFPHVCYLSFMLPFIHSLMVGFHRYAIFVYYIDIDIEIYIDGWFPQVCYL